MIQAHNSCYLNQGSFGGVIEKKGHILDIIESSVDRIQGELQVCWPEQLERWSYLLCWESL